jgi:hypothetical protein
MARMMMISGVPSPAIWGCSAGRLMGILTLVLFGGESTPDWSRV